MQISRHEFADFAGLKMFLATVMAAQVLYLRRTADKKIHLGVSDTITKVAEKVSINVEFGGPADSELSYIGRGKGFTVVESIGFSHGDVRQLVDAFGAVIDRTKTQDVYTADAWRGTDSVVCHDSGENFDTYRVGVSSARAMGAHIFGTSNGELIAGNTGKNLSRLDGWQKLSVEDTRALGTRLRAYSFSPNARVGRLVMAGDESCWNAQIFDRGRVLHITVFTIGYTFMVRQEEAARSFPIGVLGGDQSLGQIVSVEPKPGSGVVEVSLAHRGR